MSTLGIATPCLADAGAGARLCHHRPPAQQLRGPLEQLSASATPLRSGLLGLRRGFVRGSEVTRRSVPRADSETEERPRAEGNGRVGGLGELDQQLQSLSSSDDSTSATKQASKGIGEELPRKEEEKRVDWPVFGDGFKLYISVGLILLTIINNILFKLFLGPPVPRPPPFQRTEQPSSEGAQRMRYKVRSFKDPLYLERRAPPPVTDEPLP